MSVVACMYYISNGGNRMENNGMRKDVEQCDCPVSDMFYLNNPTIDDISKLVKNATQYHNSLRQSCITKRISGPYFTVIDREYKQ